jgi:ATP-dependent Clp protease adaptor protein ClpS
MEDDKTNEISDGRDRSTDLGGTVEQELFRVVIVNDDSTPMEFVVRALIEIFQKTHEDAERIMLMTHHTGRGTCGVYSRTEAESLVKQITVRAGQSGYPLQCLIEPHSLKDPYDCKRQLASMPRLEGQMYLGLQLQRQNLSDAFINGRLCDRSDWSASS